MSRTPQPGVDRRRIVLAALAGGLSVAGVGLCWILAHPAGPESAAWPGGLGVLAASLLLGMGGLELLGVEPRREMIAAVAAVWGAASVIAAWLQVADRAGVSPLHLGVDDVRLAMESGVALLVCVAGAVAVLAWSWWPIVPASAVGLVALIGVLVIATSGHAGVHPWTPVVVGVHALCAAWWIGTLGALMLCARGRRGWAQALPVFSRYALYAVGILLLTGIVAAVAELSAPEQLWSTGYGRVLLAKTVLLAGLVAVAAVHRRSWLPDVARHRGTETGALARAGLEVALGAVVLGLAAGLAATAPGLS